MSMMRSASRKNKGKPLSPSGRAERSGTTASPSAGARPSTPTGAAPASMRAWRSWWNARLAAASAPTYQPTPCTPRSSARRAPPPRYPLPDVPARLASLGFQGVNPNGTPAIVPPLITIPAGPFLMGSDKARDRQAYDDELPQHRVEVGAFQIAKYPVTVAEYALAVRAGAVREPPELWADVTWAKQQQRPDHPVVYVSWQDAMAYIAWLVRRRASAAGGCPPRPSGRRPRAGTRARAPAASTPGATASTRTAATPARAASGPPARSAPTRPATRAARRQSIRSGGDGGQCLGVDSSLYKPYPYILNDGREDPKSTENRTLRGGSWATTPGSRARRAASTSRQTSSATTGGSASRSRLRGLVHHDSISTVLLFFITCCNERLVRE